MRRQPSAGWFSAMTRVTQAEFARLCGVNRSTVSRWLQNGRIDADPSGLLDPIAAQRLRTATESPLPHHQARKAQFDEARATADAGEGAGDAPDASGDADADGEGLGTMGTLGEQLKRVTVQVQRHKAELLAIEIDKAAGALVELAEVQYVLGDFGATLRGLLEGLPDRLSGEIAAHQGDVNAIHKALEDAGREMLLAITGQMERRVEGLTP